MKKYLLLAIAAYFFQWSAAQEKKSNLQYVDPAIGGVGILLEPTRPTVHLPNSLIRVFPSRKDQLDDQVSYFPLTISSHRQASLFAIMPCVGTPAAGDERKRFTYDREVLTPYYYSGHLENTATVIEFTPSHFSGIFRFSFPGSRENYIRLNIVNAGSFVLINGNTIEGEEVFNGMKAFVHAELSAGVKDFNFSQDKKVAFVRLDSLHKMIEFRYAISFISTAQAKKNLDKELNGKSFSTVKNKARDTWDKTLSQIEITGGTLAQKKVFYTSLYRSYERMVDINEYGRYYSAYDGKVHESNDPFFIDNWIWDTYIALEPLQTILNPEMEQAKIRSYIQMYKQSGWMPSFALAFGDNPCMTGNHAAAWMMDAWSKGLQNFDIEKAYEGLKKNSLQATLLPWRNGPVTSLDSFYNKHGYMPALYPGEKEWVKEVHPFEKRQAISVTLENSFDDWCLAKMAEVLKKENDRALFLERAAYYKNVFRTEKGFMWPKDTAGKWIEPFDPKFSGGQGGRDYTTENNVYTYNWLVKHDFDGLFKLMGGTMAAEKKLDNLFEEGIGRSKYDYWHTFPDATGLVGQFVMGNEPSFHIPYLYNYMGAPWKTQKRIRMLMDTWFTDNLFGIPGDEDGGGMTAFIVFSMMGFFPVTPGVPVYNVGSPVFSSVIIHLPNKKTFTITAKNNSEKNKYIQKAFLNGKPLMKPWFEHKELLNGGEIIFYMSDAPEKNWGNKALDAPPSYLQSPKPKE